MARTYDVDGMSCGGCESNVLAALNELDGVESADADHEANEVTVEGDADDAAVVDAIEGAGYSVSA